MSLKCRPARVQCHQEQAKNMQQSIARYDPKVSIIMPVYNGERYVVDAIESALTQAYTNFEVVIIDDGSQDNSAEIIRPYLSDPRVRYIEQGNQGVAAARNAALSIARGEYVGFLDQDDLWSPNKLARQVVYMQAHPECAMVHARQAYIDDTGNPILDYPEDWVRTLEGRCFRDLFIVNGIAVLTVLMRRDILQRVGGFNPEIPRTDDYELWMRIAHDYPIGFMDEVLAHYRVHGGNTSHDHLKMEIAELGAIESVLRRFPDARGRVGRSVVRQRLLDLHQMLGDGYMWRLRDFARARDHYAGVLRLAPFHMKSLRRWLWCSLPSQHRKNLAWQAQKFRRLIS